MFLITKLQTINDPQKQNIQNLLTLDIRYHTLEFISEEYSLKYLSGSSRIFVLKKYLLFHPENVLL